MRRLYWWIPVGLFAMLAPLCTYSQQAKQDEAFQSEDEQPGDLFGSAGCSGAGNEIGPAPDRWIPAGLFAILLPHGGYPLQTKQGDVFQSGGGQQGDVFQSGSCPGVDNDERHYIKNGTFDRCGWATAHYKCDPLTKRYGMPVHVDMITDGLQYRDQYARCAGDPCSPDKVVCWGWKDRGQGQSPSSQGGITNNFCSSPAACYSPLRGPTCPNVRFGQGNCPGTKYACDWCYGPSGVFAYSPRGSIYTFTSNCNKLGSNTTWVPTDSTVATWMKNAGGKCAPNERGRILCTDVDVSRFKQQAGCKRA